MSQSMYSSVNKSEEIALVDFFTYVKIKILKSDSHLPKNCVICFIESPLKMMKKYFLFHLKSSFRDQDI